MTSAGGFVDVFRISHQAIRPPLLGFRTLADGRLALAQAQSMWSLPLTLVEAWHVGVGPVKIMEDPKLLNGSSTFIPSLIS